MNGSGRDADLSVDVGRIFRIGELRVEVESEARFVVDLLVAQQDRLASGGAFDVLGQDVVDDRIDVVVHVLEETRKSVLDAQLQLFQEVGVVERQDLHVVLGFAFLDPPHRLCSTRNEDVTSLIVFVM